MPEAFIFLVNVLRGWVWKEMCETVGTKGPYFPIENSTVRLFPNRRQFLSPGRLRSFPSLCHRLTHSVVKRVQRTESVLVTVTGKNGDTEEKN